jgi:hypothetical protein
MPGNPNDCRNHARNRLRLAEAATSREATRTFVDLAHSWTRLAVALENAQPLLVGLHDMKRTGGATTTSLTAPSTD